MPSHNIPVGILPLGTGNDMARTLGWGGGLTNVSTIPDLMKLVKESAIELTLDRWLLKINKPNQDPETKIVNNYFSVGLDAKVAQSFHETRNKNPEMFVSQTVNKMWYFKFGTEAIVDGCAGLENDVVLMVDGELKVIDTPIEALVVVNLPSCYGGVFLWQKDSRELGSFSPLSINDDTVEIVGIKNSVHLAQICIGAAIPIYIAQGKRVEISFNKPLHVQIDGEPWLQDPCTLNFDFYRKSKVLALKREMHSSLLSQIKK